MKESLAKTKFCPQTAVSRSIMTHTLTCIYGGSKKTAKDDQLYEQTAITLSKAMNCLGSGCMMWEDWTKREYTEIEYYEGDPEPPPPEGDGWKKYGVPQRIARPAGPVDIRQRWVRDLSTGHGNCGLISKRLSARL